MRLCALTIPTLLPAVFTLAYPTSYTGDVLGKRQHAVYGIRRNTLGDLSNVRVSNASANASQSIIFDPYTVSLAVHGIIDKYSQAARFLNGVGLNPDTHPETSYPPFNDTPIIQYFRNHTSFHPTISTQDDPSSNGTSGNGNISAADPNPILGLPQANYTEFHVMTLKDDIENGMDVSYYGPLGFGTPAQQLSVSVDTGSADLWIPAVCPSCSNEQFAPSVSSTYQGSNKKITLSYGAGHVSGTVAQDVVSLGALSVDKQRFVAVRSESEDFMDYPSSGLLGLAFRSISRMNAPNFFENLLSQHKLSAAMFSIHLTRGQEDGSQICLGCYDLTKTVGPVQWFNITTKTYWAISMDGIAPDKLHSAGTDLIAAIDTGTSLLLVPDNVARQFYALIPGARDAAMEHGTGFYIFPCSSPLAISLSFSKQAFGIKTDDFNLGKLSEDSTDCVGGIIGVDPNSGFPSNLAIIGDIFLKSWYSSYDYAGSRVGFAPSVNIK